MALEQEAIKITEQYESQIKAAKELATLREKEMALLNAELELEQKIQDIVKANFSTTKELADVKAKELEYTKAKKELEEAINNNDQQKIVLAQSNLEAKIKDYETSKQALKSEKDKIKAFEDQVKKIQQVGESLKKSYKDGEDAAKKMFGVSQSFFDQFKGKSADEVGQFFTGFMKQAVSMGSIFSGLAQAADKIGKALLDGFNFPILGTRIKGLRELVTDVLKGPAEAFKKFGFLEQYENSIESMRQRMLGTGVAEKELRDAFGNLNQVIAQFPSYSKKTQESLANTQIRLSQLGVDGRTAATSMNNFMKVFGQTATQAAESSAKLAEFSLKLGQGTKGLEDFTTMAPKLAGFGDKAVSVFKETASAAKFLGMETKELFDLMDRYDTFDKAAEAAGELNAAFGGPFIGSMELMQASLEGGTLETLTLIQGAFQKAGIEVEKLSRAEKKYFASTLGMTEDQLKAVGKGSEGIQKYVKDQEAATKKQEDLNALAAKTQDIFMKIQNAFAAAFGDPKTIQSLEKMVQFMAKAANFMANMVSTAKSLIPALTAITAVGGFVALAGAIRTVIGVIQLMRVATIRAAIADAVKMAFGGPAGWAALGISAAVAGGAALLISSKYGEGGEGAGAAGEVTSAVGGNKGVGGQVTIETEDVEDAVAPGGSMIMTPSGRALKTSSADTITASKEGGALNELAKEFSSMRAMLQKVLENPVQPKLVVDGRELSKSIRESDTNNPFIGKSPINIG
jgi:tetratricopeptide (TPR) repeat protein